MVYAAHHPRQTHRPVGKIIAIAAAVSLVSGFGAGAGVAAIVKASATSQQSVMSLVGQGGGADTMSYDYTGSYSGALTADGKSVESSGETVSATSSDQNAALVQNGGTLTITNGKLTKSGDSDNADNCNFYGTNSALLAVGEKSKAIISDSSIDATSSGSNAIFSTDSASVLANNVNITTSAANSRGLDATYGGSIIANAMTISTKGDHSASLATDRGGGSVSVTDPTLNTAGSGSPLLYSTGSDPVANGVIIYQSTSGDAESSTGQHATFQAKDSTLKSAITSGSMFYFTNTTADVVLSNTDLDFDSDVANLIMAAGNDSNNWGTAGSNGATVNFTGRSQTLKGKVSADTISSVTLNLLEGSTWTGSAEITENSAGSTSDAPITVNVDGTSTWVVTADTTVSALNVADGGKVVDSSGKTVTIKANGKTVVSGDSDLTVTVTGSYGTTVEAGSDTELSSDVTDRTAFDKQFGTSTSWSF